LGNPPVEELQQDGALNAFEKQNLEDLADYLVSKGITSHGGFNPKDDWDWYAKLTLNSIRILDAVEKLAKARLFDITTTYKGLLGP
jgi:hypothetical protein